jgi:hypothetical protein
MYYNGFCNSVLWQLFHYVPLNIDSWLKMSEHKAMQMQWQAYQVNSMTCWHSTAQHSTAQVMVVWGVMVGCNPELQSSVISHPTVLEHAHIGTCNLC